MEIQKSIAFIVFVFSTVIQAFNFTFNGFQSADLLLDNAGEVTAGGLLRLTNSTNQTGHCFNPNRIAFKNSSDGSALSFSTSFAFGIVGTSYPRQYEGHGFAFVISPTTNFSSASPNKFLGMFNGSSNGLESNHIVAVEFDIMYNVEFSDVDNNHVGIDINGLTSANSSSAGYFEDDGNRFVNLTLASGESMQAWIEYDGVSEQMTVTIAPESFRKPKTPLLILKRDLSPYLLEFMYVGFSSSTGPVLASHYVQGWSFNNDGDAEQLKKLPGLPRSTAKRKLLIVILPVVLSVTLISLSCLTMFVLYKVYTRRRLALEREDWEKDYRPIQYNYKELYEATRGFSDELGRGAFGIVYRGYMSNSGQLIAVKAMHNSPQVTKQFVAEIESLGRMRHRNLVRLLGYCGRPGKLLIVYEYLQNGSFDRYLHNTPRVTLSWSKRFHVVKGVAAGILYLHEQWEKTVIHRDIKAANVMLDENFNGKLGDFGSARQYIWELAPQATHVIGTPGYIAPELAIESGPTTNSDVFAFGAFLLEVGCGRRPIQVVKGGREIVLVEWVFSLWSKGEIMEARDPYMGWDFDMEEVEMVLKLGLLCSSFEAGDRPAMREVVDILEKVAPLPPFSTLNIYGGRR